MAIITFEDKLCPDQPVYRIKARCSRNGDSSIIQVKVIANNFSDRTVERLLSGYQGGGWYCLNTPQPVEE